MTVFATSDMMELDTTCAVWDLFLVDGWKAVFRVALALLSGIQVSLLAREIVTLMM